MTDIQLCVLAWIVILLSIVRGYRKSRTVDRFALLTWSIFVAIGLVFTFKTPLVAHAIDDRFGDYPVAYWLKTLATLAAVLFYSISLQEFTTHDAALLRRAGYHRAVIRLAWIVILALSLLLAASVLHVLSYRQARFAMKWVLEGYMLLHIVPIFIPVNRRVLRHEQVEPMRLKHIATLVLCVTYALSAVITLVSVPPIIVTGQINPGPGLVPRHMIGLVCLLIMLVPHRWLVLYRVPEQVMRYLKLAALERRLAEQVPFTCEPVHWWQVLRPRYPEMATYVTVINILDHYRRLDMDDPAGATLYRQIDAVIPANPDYDDLVRAMSRVTR